MGLDEILKSINDEFDAKAAAILEKANREASDIIEEARKHVQSEIAEIEQHYAKMGDQMKRQKISKARIITKKELLIVRDDMIKECFSELTKEMAAMKVAEREKFISKSMKAAINEIPKGTVIPSKKDVDIIKKILPKNYIMSDKTNDAIGGFVVYDTEGKISINYTFEEIIDRKKDEIRTLFARILFGE